MTQQQIMAVFETHPVLGTILMIASMFFLSVWWRGWPEWSFGNEEEEDDDFDNEKKYTISWEKTSISLDSRGLPEKAQGTLTIKEEEDD